MKRLCIIFAIGLLFCANSYAAGAKDVVVREVIGRGSTRSQAVKDALYVAVGQARGVEVDSGRYELGFSESGIGLESDKTDKGKSRRIQFDSISVDTSGTVYTTKIGGSVKTYEVLEEKEIAENPARLSEICTAIGLVETQIEQLYLRWEELDKQKLERFEWYLFSN